MLLKSMTIISKLLRCVLLGLILLTGSVTLILFLSIDHQQKVPRSPTFGSQNQTSCTDTTIYRKSVDAHQEQDASFAHDGVDCAAVINGLQSAIDIASNITVNKMSKSPCLSLKEYRNVSNNCEQFKTKYGYVMHVYEEELSFPIAFTILFHKDLHQMELLLRAIYRPHNLYCIHLDRKAPAYLNDATTSLSDCFNNVFLSSRRIYIEWGKISVLDATMGCLKELHQIKSWKYYINLSGQEFPLKTYLQLVRILRAYNGANDIEMLPRNITNKFQHRWGGNQMVPLNVSMVKGEFHVALSRRFVDFVLTDSTVQKFYQFLSGIRVPDEHFFNTIQANPEFQAPGAFIGMVPKDKDEPALGYNAREKWWHYDGHTCQNLQVRSICVIGVGELNKIVQSRRLFVNKLYWNRQPYSLLCLNQWFWNRTRDEYAGKYKFDVSGYAKLPFVIHRSRL